MPCNRVGGRSVLTSNECGLSRYCTLAWGWAHRFVLNHVLVFVTNRVRATRGMLASMVRRTAWLCLVACEYAETVTVVA